MWHVGSVEQDTDFWSQILPDWKDFFGSGLDWIRFEPKMDSDPDYPKANQIPENTEKEEVFLHLLSMLLLFLCFRLFTSRL